MNLKLRKFFFNRLFLNILLLIILIKIYFFCLLIICTLRIAQNLFRLPSECSSVHRSTSSDVAYILVKPYSPSRSSSSSLSFSLVWVLLWPNCLSQCNSLSDPLKGGSLSLPAQIGGIRLLRILWERYHRLNFEEQLRVFELEKRHEQPALKPLSLPADFSTGLVSLSNLL